MNLTFTTDKASAASVDGNLIINETCKAVCTILEADTYERTNNGVAYQIVRLLVQDTRKYRQTVELLVGGGNSDWHIRLFNSLLTCAHIDTCNFHPATVTPHRRGVLDDKSQNFNGFRSRELEKKEVGIVFQKQWRAYQDKQGNMRDGYDIRPVRFFDAKTEQTAKEVINGLPAEALADFISRLSDKGAPMYDKAQGGQPQDTQFEKQPVPAQTADTYSDDQYF